MIRRNNLHLGDVTIGLFAGLLLEGVKGLSSKGQSIDKAFELVYPVIVSEANRLGLRIRFSEIRTHPLHGDSLQVQEELSLAVRYGCISWKMPGAEIIIEGSPEEARALLGRLPGDSEMYRKIARAFREEYRKLV
ncbi:hypothetical protein HYV88_02000 [Candidatus Woesearchaeota archaeon]|nr:hypothetical protein [Candidatus Woesearchaeota archaeon]